MSTPDNTEPVAYTRAKLFDLVLNVDFVDDTVQFQRANDGASARYSRPGYDRLRRDFNNITSPEYIGYSHGAWVCSKPGVGFQLTLRPGRSILLKKNCLDSAIMADELQVGRVNENPPWDDFNWTEESKRDALDLPSVPNVPNSSEGSPRRIRVDDGEEENEDSEGGSGTDNDTAASADADVLQGAVHLMGRPEPAVATNKVLGKRHSARNTTRISSAASAATANLAPKRPHLATTHDVVTAAAAAAAAAVPRQLPIVPPVAAVPSPLVARAPTFALPVLPCVTVERDGDLYRRKYQEHSQSTLIPDSMLHSSHSDAAVFLTPLDNYKCFECGRHPVANGKVHMYACMACLHCPRPCGGRMNSDLQCPHERHRVDSDTPLALGALKAIHIPFCRCPSPTRGKVTFAVVVA